MRSCIVIATLLLLAASCGSVTSRANDGGTGGYSGTGLTNGTGGTGGSGGTTCDQIQSAYKAALAVARKCFVGGLIDQCPKMVTNALGCGGCPTFVDDDSGTSQIENAWNQARCGQSQVCTDGPCRVPQGATCEPSDAGGGICVDSVN